jgi:ABC-type branched-subunit amino acid transport system ATPase component/ABC-type branched-subunit amino acid transport system permease subunit
MLQQLDYWNPIIIFAIFAISLNLVQGYTGQLTVAQAAFGAVGGYSAALLSVHLGAPFLVGCIVGIALGFVFGVLLSIPALGVDANYVILLTLAFAYIVSDLLSSVSALGGATGILGVGVISLFGLQITSQYGIFVLFLIIGLLVLGFCWRVGESGYGRILKGMREDESAVRSLGKNTVVYQALIFGLGSGLAGLAGAMFSFYFGNATPTEFSLNEAILFVIMVVIGGAGNLFGSIVGAILITASTPALEDWIKVSPNTATYWQQSVYGILLILIMIFRPAGLFPEHVAGTPHWWQRMFWIRGGLREPELALAAAAPAAAVPTVAPLSPVIESTRSAVPAVPGPTQAEPFESGRPVPASPAPPAPFTGTPTAMSLADPGASPAAEREIEREIAETETGVATAGPASANASGNGASGTVTGNGAGTVTGNGAGYGPRDLVSDAVAAEAGAHEPGEPEPVARVSVNEALGQAFEPVDDGLAAGTPILEVTDLVKSFGGIQAVRGVSLQVPARQVTALIGPNGAGKSTLFGLFTGFIPADGGSVRLKGTEVRGKTPNAIAGMGMVRSFQDVRLFRYMTCLQNVMLAIPGQDCEHMWRLFATPWTVRRTEKQTRDRAMEILRWVGMDHRANELTGGLGHGEQKLVAIARVLATGADLLLLDEPTSGVDPEWVERVAEVIRELPNFGRTVCVVEHNLGFLQMLDAGCYFMEAGRIRTHGRLDELMADEELRHAYFGV